MSDAYRDVTFAGGQINTSFIPLWLGLVTGLGMVPPTYSASNPSEAANVLVQHSGGALSFQGAQILDSATGGNAAYDGPFYDVRSPIDMISRDHIPTFIVGGWFDLFQRGEPLLYRALRREHVPAQLLMGPWYHITAGDGLPSQGVPTLNDLELRWMNHYVKGIPDPGLGKLAPVTYYENGSGKWRTAGGWYAPGVRFHALHLSGPASPQSPGKLSANRPSVNRVPTPWSTTRPQACAAARRSSGPQGPEVETAPRAKPTTVSTTPPACPTTCRSRSRCTFWDR